MATCAGCLSGCCLVVLRAFLFLSCLLLTVTGIRLVFSHGQAGENKALEDSDEFIHAPSWLYTLFLLSAVFGLHGSCTRDPRSLKLFAIVFTFFALMQGYLSYRLAAGEAEHVDKFNQTLAEEFPSYIWSPGIPNPATDHWDSVQRTYKCCGLRSSSDWSYHVNKPKRLAFDILPASCCHLMVDSCRAELNPSLGCLQSYKGRIDMALLIGKTMTFIIALLVILALLVVDRKRPAAGRPVFARFSQASNSVQTWRPLAPFNEKEFTRMAPNAPPPPSYTFN